MEISFIHRTDALVLCIILFVSMLLMIIIGRRAGKLWGKSEEEDPKGGVSSMLTALFALFGFILAFTFSMSGTRFEKVRDVVSQETKEIGTAILRSDLYNDSTRNEFRADFKDYLEAVIAFYENVTNPQLLQKAEDDAAKAQQRLWNRAVTEARLHNMIIPSNNMIVSLNSMFDIAQKREILLRSKVPDLIVYMLFICALTSSFIGGFTSKAFRHKDWIIAIGFALMSTAVVYITLDLARPMRGIIQTPEGLQAITELRKMF